MTVTDAAGGGPATEAAPEVEESDEQPAGRERRRVPAIFRHPHRWWLAAILTVNGAMELWDLQRMGLQNTFYAAAAWSAGKSWHAFFFAGLDPVGGAMIDKPPLSSWAQGLSIRVFGFNSSALLLPQAAMGIACSALLYLAVRRLCGTTAGLLAAAAMTLTPVGVWMFKGDGPDPLLVLLLVAAAYLLIRALGSGGIWWMVACGAAVGFAFNAKMLEAMIVLPGLVLAVLVCGVGSLVKRVAGLLAAGASMVVTGLWWMVVVQLTPAADRPYVSSTNSNSVFDLAFGYNGAQRLGLSSSSLRTSDRLFVGPMGLLISFLLPAALLAIPVLLMGPRGGRRSPYRAAGVLFGGWLLAGAVTLTYSSGLINSYYVLVIAPPIAALVAAAGVGLWRHIQEPAAAIPLTLMVAASAVWGTIELHSDSRLPAWVPLLVGTAGLTLTALTLRAAVSRSAQPGSAQPGSSGSSSGAAQPAVRTRLLSGSSAIMLLVAVLLPTATAAMAEVGTVHEPPMFFSHQSGLLAALTGDTSNAAYVAAVAGGRQAAELELQTGRAVLDIGGYRGLNSLPTLPVLEHLVLTHQIRYFIRPIGPPAHPALHRLARPTAARGIAADAHRARAGAKAAHPPLHRVASRSRVANSAARTTAAQTARARITAAHAIASRTQARRAVVVVHRYAPSLAAQFTSWVIAHYRLVYSDGSDNLYDLSQPIPPAPQHRTSHLTRTPARHTAKVIGKPIRYARKS